MKDRVAREKNGEQDARLDDLSDDLTDAEIALSTHDLAFQSLTARVQVAEDAISRNNGRVESLLTRLAALEAAPQPPDDPAPNPEPTPTGWKPKWSGSKVSDWDSKLIEGYNASITETAEGLRFYIPGPGPKVSGGRCELQTHKPENGGGPAGSEQAYEWEFKIAKTTLGTGNQGRNLICQTHADVSSFTGGIDLRPDGYVYLRNGGGAFVSDAGHTYASMVEERLGRFAFDTWHRIRIEAKWEPVSGGYVRARLDSGPWFGKSNCPTIPSDATNQMFRVGFYPSSDLPGPLTMVVRGVKVEVPA